LQKPETKKKTKYQFTKGPFERGRVACGRGLVWDMKTHRSEPGKCLSGQMIWRRKRLHGNDFAVDVDLSCA
ncbi:MAG: hypothetical protein ACHP79_19320, partial [Terriglobales bacterium]